MGLRQTAGRAVIWASLGWVLTNVIQFVATIFTARLLSPAEFGLVSIALVVVSTVQIFADAGTRAALVQKDGDIRDEVSTAMITVPAAGAVGAALIAGCSTLLADFFGEPELTPVAIALSGFVFVYTLTIVPDALLQRNFQTRWRRGVVDPLAVTLYGATVITLAILGYGVWSLVIGQYVSVLTILTGSWLLARPRFREGRPSLAAWRGIRRYGRHLLVASIIETVDGQAPTVALGRAIGPAAVGLWSAGHRLALLPLTGITHVAGQAIFPALSRMQSDPERLRTRALESLRLLSLMTIPLSVSLIALGEPMVVALFGEEWRRSGEVLQILGIWALGLSLTEAGREFFKASDRTNLVARNAYVESGAFIAVLVALVATDRISLLTVALGRVLSAVAAMLVAVPSLRSAVGTTPAQLWSAVRPAAIGGAAQCAAMLALVHLALPGFDAWRHVGGVYVGVALPLALLGLLALAGALAFVATVELADRGTVRRLIGSIRLIVRPAPAGG